MLRHPRSGRATPSCGSRWTCPRLADQRREFDYLAPAGTVEVGTVVRVPLARPPGRRLGRRPPTSNPDPGLRLARVAKVSGLGTGTAEVVELTAWGGVAVGRPAHRPAAGRVAAGRGTRPPARRRGGAGAGARGRRGDRQLARDAPPRRGGRGPGTAGRRSVGRSSAPSSAPDRRWSSSAPPAPPAPSPDRLPRRGLADGTAARGVGAGCRRRDDGRRRTGGGLGPSIGYRGRRCARRPRPWSGRDPRADLERVGGRGRAGPPPRAPVRARDTVPAARAAPVGTPARRRAGTTERRGWAPVDVLDRHREDPRERAARRATRSRCCGTATAERGRVRPQPQGPRALAGVPDVRLGHGLRALRRRRWPSRRRAGLTCHRCHRIRPAVCQHCGSAALKATRLGVTTLREDLEALARLPVGGGHRGDGDGARVPRSSSGRRPCCTGSASPHGGGAPRLRRRAPRRRGCTPPRRRSPCWRWRRAWSAAATRGGRVLVQTRQPDHPVVQAAVRADPGPAGRAGAERAGRARRCPAFTALAEITGEPALVEAAGSAVAGRHGVEVVGDGTGPGAGAGAATTGPSATRSPKAAGQRGRERPAADRRRPAPDLTRAWGVRSGRWSLPAGGRVSRPGRSGGGRGRRPPGSRAHRCRRSRSAPCRRPAARPEADGPAPTPAGVPVEITSPGSSVNAVDRCSIICQQSKIMSAVGAVLAQLAVDGGADAQAVGIVELVVGHHPRPDRPVGVPRLAHGERGGPVLPVAHADVVDDHPTGDDLAGPVARGRADTAARSRCRARPRSRPARTRGAPRSARPGR